MNDIRRAAVAGMFYPENPKQLKSIIEDLLADTETDTQFNDVFGVVSPHAGYTYSGFSAAHSYNVLKNKDFDTAIILSPSHREYFPGMSIYSGKAYQTPLGILEIDKELSSKFIECSDLIFESERGHGSEHAVEVQLPFLQVIKKQIKIVPIVIGDQKKTFIDELAECLSKNMSERTVIIASSDLSHFYSKQAADGLDSIIESRIKKFEFDDLQRDLEKSNCEACGGGGIVALLKAARLKNYQKTKILSRTDSGDTSGDNSSVVGYLSAVVYN